MVDWYGLYTFLPDIFIIFIDMCRHFLYIRSVSHARVRIIYNIQCLTFLCTLSWCPNVDFSIKCYLFILLILIWTVVLLYRGAEIFVITLATLRIEGHFTSGEIILLKYRFQHFSQTMLLRLFTVYQCLICLFNFLTISDMLWTQRSVEMCLSPHLRVSLTVYEVSRNTSHILITCYRWIC